MEKVIVAKYGEDDQGWVRCKVPRYRVLSMWGSILKFGDESSLGGRCSPRVWVIKWGGKLCSMFWLMTGCR